MFSLYNVMQKEALINLRIDPKVRDEFKIAAQLRGATMSGLLHMFIARTIREEKSANAEAFQSTRKGFPLIEIGSESKTRTG